MDKYVFPTSGGVVVHAGDKKVISVTDCGGQRRLASFEEKNKVIFWHFPFFRGIQLFFCGIMAQFSAFLLHSDLCNSKKVVMDKRYYVVRLAVFVACVLLGCVTAALALGLLPGRIGFAIVGASGNTFLRNLLILALKIVMFYLLVLALRIFSPMSELFRFNRAADRAQILGEACKTKKFCPANPTNFLNFLIFVFILDTIVVTLVGANFGFAFNLLFHACVLFLCIGVGFEVLNLLSKTKKLRNLAFVTQILVASKPTLTHLETALVAMSEIKLLTSQKGRELMTAENYAFSVVYSEVRNKLSAAGVTDKSEADWLIATVLGKNRAEIKLIGSITEKQRADILRATTRRAKGESLDNIFGFTEFYGLRFDVNKKVLTPRMETELLVEQALTEAKKLTSELEKKFSKNSKLAKNAPKILDLCTGSGAIAVAIKKNCPLAEVTATDISKPALAVAQINAKKNDVEVEFLHSNLFEGLKRRKKFDIIVSNPPYIASADIPKLDKNVRECDPLIALDGGADGLDFYRSIVPKATKHLTSGGVLMVEIGKGQGAKVRKIFRDSGFENIKTIKDYNKLERIICGKIE